MTDLDHRVLEYPAPNRDTQRPLGEHDRRTGSGRRLLGLGALLLLLGGLAFGVLRHYAAPRGHGCRNAASRFRPERPRLSSGVEATSSPFPV